MWVKLAFTKTGRLVHQTLDSCTVTVNLIDEKSKTPAYSCMLIYL